jgi:hypothetical protein
MQSWSWNRCWCESRRFIAAETLVPWPLKLQNQVRVFFAEQGELSEDHDGRPTISGASCDVQSGGKQGSNDRNDVAVAVGFSVEWVFLHV